MNKILKLMGVTVVTLFLLLGSVNNINAIENDNDLQSNVELSTETDQNDTEHIVEMSQEEFVNSLDAVKDKEIDEEIILSENGLNYAIGKTKDGKVVYSDMTYEEIIALNTGKVSRAIGNTISSNTWKQGASSTWIARLWIEGVGDVYCLSPGAPFPTGQNYDAGTIYNNAGVMAILAYGFPMNIAGDRPAHYDDNDAYNSTYLALSTYLYPDGFSMVPGGYVMTRSWLMAQGDTYLNTLIARGQAGTVPNADVKITAPSNKESFVNEGANVTDWYKVSGGSTVTVSNLPSKVSIQLKNGSLVSNGQTFNSNQDFRFYTKDFNFSGDVKATFTSNIKKRTAIIYTAPGVQNLVGSGWADPLTVQSPTAKFTSPIYYAKATKLDSDNNVVEGVKIEIADNEYFDNSKEVITDSLGNTEQTEFIIGSASATLYAREIEVPDNMVLDKTVQSKAINATETATFDFVNDFRTLEILKVSESGEELEGARFKLFEKIGNISDLKVRNNVDDDYVILENGSILKFITEGVTEIDGRFVVDNQNIKHSTTYYIQEVDAPEGHVLDNSYIELEQATAEDSVISITLENKIIRGDIILQKNDDRGNSYAGAEVDLLKYNYSLEEYEYFDTLVTEDEIVVSIDDYNKLKNRDYLQNVIIDEEQETVTVPGATYVSDLVFSDWAFKEITAPDGTVIFDDLIEFQIDEDGVVSVVTLENEIIKSNIIVQKIDNKGKTYGGAEFEILDDNMQYVTKLITKENLIISLDEYDKISKSNKSSLVGIKIDEEKEIVTIPGASYVKDVSYGTNYIKEIKAPDGTIIFDGLIDFEVTEHGATLVASFVNERIELAETGLANISIITIIVAFVLVVLRKAHMLM